MENSDPILSVKQGQLRGRQMVSSYSQKPFYSFLGIPYAVPPIGNRRFKAPEPAPNWTGVFDGTIEKNVCIQYNPFVLESIGSEDCLYLNVNIPEYPPPEEILKPVIVMVHGGGNYYGSGNVVSVNSNSPDFIIHRDIVYVTINYRLHVFGFLNLGLPDCQGNMAMKDIVLAFKWVKENISVFGGDPENITAATNSSSASLTHLLLMSPTVSGLFNKVILQSGYAFNPVMCYQENGLEIAFEFGKLFDYDGKNPATLLNILMRKSGTELMEATNELISIEKKKFAGCYSPRSPFIPSVERIREGAILPVSPRDLIDQIERVPMIAGICDKESMLLFAANPMNTVQKHFKSVVKKICWMHDIDYKTLKEISAQLKNFYFHDQTISYDNISELLDFYTDGFFAEYYETLIDVMSRNYPHVPVYVYQFEYEGQFNFMKQIVETVIGQPIKGACHADDFNYWLRRSETEPDERDVEIVETICKLWTNFAKCGNPNDETLNFYWKPCNPESHTFLRLGENMEIVNEKMRGKGLLLWESIIKRLKQTQKMDSRIEV